MQQPIDRSHLLTTIFNATSANFDTIAMILFRYQYNYNLVYRSFCDLLHIIPERITTVTQIPFLPILFFKTKAVVSTNSLAKFYFESSGTTATINSKHYVADSAVYDESFLASFKSVYGEVTDWCIVGLLPGYLERKNSSLVYMVNKLIELSQNESSGFYLNDYEALALVLKRNESMKQKTLLIGVTFALIDFSKKFATPLRYTTIMETGGMKGKLKEITRTEVHTIIGKSFGLTHVHSEYGMTELLSQAYAIAYGKFLPAATMKILLRSEDDPMDITDAEQLPNAKAGALNIIDLANIDSCSFIATDDLGILHPDGSFEVVGRLDNSDIRGCGLMLIN